MWLSPVLVSVMQRRLLLLPLLWGGYGLGEVFVANYLLGPIVNLLPYPPNDKPIGGSFLPLLGYNVAALLLVIGLSLYSLGIWNIDLSNPKTRRDLIALGITTGSLLGIFTFPILLFSAVAALVYLLATNID
jgi:hypothetical protein